MEIETTAPTEAPAAAEREAAPAPQQDKGAPVKTPSVREAVEAAMAQVDRSDAVLEGASPDDREAVQMLRGEQPTALAAEAEQADDKPNSVKRAPDGKFAPASDKPAAKAEEKPNSVSANRTDDNSVSDDEPPPARLSAEAKAAWKDAPEAVRADIRRTIKEMEGGIEKYRADAAELEGLDDLKEFAKQNGITANQAMKRLWQAHNVLQRDPVAGFDHIARSMGLSLQDIAAHVLGQNPNQNIAAAERALAERDKLIAQQGAELKRYRDQAQQAELHSAQTQIETFFKANPMADKLRADMATVIDRGLADDLQQAFNIACMRNGISPSGVAEPPPPPAPTRDIAAQTRRGSASISGAPSAGSDPGFATPASSAREASERALRAVGLL